MLTNIDAVSRTEVNADRTKYMVVSRNQNGVGSRNIKTDNSSLERVEQFRYLGTSLTNQNSIQEDINLLAKDLFF